MNAAETAALALMKQLVAADASIRVNADLQFGIVDVYTPEEIVAAADDCRADFDGVFTIYATADNGDRVGAQIEIDATGGLYVRGIGKV